MKTECIHSRVQKTRRRVCTAHGKCSINVSYKGVTQLWELWRRGQMRTVHCWLPFNGKPQDVEPPACDADALWWLATLQTPGLAFHFLLSFLIWVPLTTETSAGPFLPPPPHTHPMAWKPLATQPHRELVWSSRKVREWLSTIPQPRAPAQRGHIPCHELVPQQRSLCWEKAI